MCASCWLQRRGAGVSFARALIGSPRVPGDRSLPRAITPACRATPCWRLRAAPMCAAVSPLVVGAFAHAA